MKGFDISGMGEACKRLNPDVGKPPPPPPPGEPALKAENVRIPERELQAKCERLLEAEGFRRLAAKHAAFPARGWFGHLAKPIGNPLLPDLFVFHEPNDRPALLVELKVREDYQPGQREMVSRKMWRLCRTFEEFRRALWAWETGEKES